MPGHRGCLEGSRDHSHMTDTFCQGPVCSTHQHNGQGQVCDMWQTRACSSDRITEESSQTQGYAAERTQEGWEEYPGITKLCLEVDTGI